MTSGPEGDNEIFLKRSGKRARVEITLDDLDTPTRPLPTVTQRQGGAPAPTRESTPVRRDPVSVEPRGGGSPPVRLPPTRYIHDEDVPWWRSRTAAWAGAVGLAVLVCITVAVVVLSSGTDPAEVAYDELNGSRTVVIGAMDSASEATKLLAVREAGRSAGVALDELQSPEATVRDIDDAVVRDAAVDLVAAERGYLEALEQLERVNRALVSERSLARWSEIRRRLSDRQREVVSASERVSRLALPGDPSKVQLTDTAMDETLQNVTRTVTGARDRLAAYRQATLRYERAVARARAKERAINAYRGPVASALSAYQADRKKVDAFVLTADEIGVGESAARARNDVSGFVSDRERTVRELANALAAAPESVRSAHRNLEVPIRDSLEGLRALDTAIYEYETDPYAGRVFGSVTDTPGWTDFQRKSDDATSSYERARSAWESAVTDAVKEVKDRGEIPDRPNAPAV